MEGSGTPLVSGDCDTCVIVGQFTLDLAARQVFLGSEPVDLQWRQFEALRLLVEANGEPVERERLLKKLIPAMRC